MSLATAAEAVAVFAREEVRAARDGVDEVLREEGEDADGLGEGVVAAVDLVDALGLLEDGAHRVEHVDEDRGVRREGDALDGLEDDLDDGLDRLEGGDDLGDGVLDEGEGLEGGVPVLVHARQVVVELHDVDDVLHHVRQAAFEVGHEGVARDEGRLARLVDARPDLVLRQRRRRRRLPFRRRRRAASSEEALVVEEAASPRQQKKSPETTTTPWGRRRRGQSATTTSSSAATREGEEGEPHEVHNLEAQRPLRGAEAVREDRGS
mmetsp:Transcript_24272/g.78446  ORF Transcript_24272/g.78446 Transcript_24272/m.78446 type:complete len:265 (+) Transcript_24272:232-1026(+)